MHIRTLKKPFFSFLGDFCPRERDSQNQKERRLPAILYRLVGKAVERSQTESKRQPSRCKCDHFAPSISENARLQVPDEPWTTKTLPVSSTTISSASLFLKKVLTTKINSGPSVEYRRQNNRNGVQIRRNPVHVELPLYTGTIRADRPKKNLDQVHFL